VSPSCLVACAVVAFAADPYETSWPAVSRPEYSAPAEMAPALSVPGADGVSVPAPGALVMAGAAIVLMARRRKRPTPTA
jgi:hypothetical protein